MKQQFKPGYYIDDEGDFWIFYPNGRKEIFNTIGGLTEGLWEVWLCGNSNIPYTFEFVDDL